MGKHINSLFLLRFSAFIFAVLIGALGVFVFLNFALKQNEKEALEHDRLVQVIKFMRSHLKTEFVHAAYSLNNIGISVDPYESIGGTIFLKAPEEDRNFRVHEGWDLRLKNVTVQDVTEEQRAIVEAKFRELEATHGAFVQLKFKEFLWVEPSTVQISFSWELNHERFGWNYKPALWHYFAPRSTVFGDLLWDQPADE